MGVVRSRFPCDPYGALESAPSDVAFFFERFTKVAFFSIVFDPLLLLDLSALRRRQEEVRVRTEGAKGGETARARKEEEEVRRNNF